MRPDMGEMAEARNDQMNDKVDREKTKTERQREHGNPAERATHHTTQLQEEKEKKRTLNLRINYKKPGFWP